MKKNIYFRIFNRKDAKVTQRMQKIFITYGLTRRLILIMVLGVMGMFSFGQQIKELSPVLSTLIDKSEEEEKKYLRKLDSCNKIKKQFEGKKYNKLTAKEKQIYDSCSIDRIEYWDVGNIGCSWYCGGGQDTATASSELNADKGITYYSSNTHDFSYKTAWIEGAEGYGIGEYLVYHFPPENPRITKIIIVNGYVKSEKLWNANSRVKKLKMYIDDEPFAILNLVDCRREQEFEFEPIGNRDRNNGNGLSNKPWWTMKFEIMEVYKGDLYNHTAITEIYYDGIDVHCFAAITPILMSDGSNKKIENIKQGDSIYSFNTASNQLFKTKVNKLITVKHSMLVKLTFEDREIICTADHPFYTINKQWASVAPEKSNSYYLQDSSVIELKTNDRILLSEKNKNSKLVKIEEIKVPQKTYTLELSNGDSYIANGLIVKTENIKKK